MEALFIIGSILIIIACIIFLGTVIFHFGRLESAKPEDFLENYYEEESK